jgi:hypothetical protein
MDTTLNVIAVLAFWFVCAMINLAWYKRNPNVMAVEFHPLLIVLAPLAAFFVIFGTIGVYLYNALLRLMGVNPSAF